jgi:branched-chain amino acid transport system ATP-binding protein
LAFGTSEKRFDASYAPVGAKSPFGAGNRPVRIAARIDSLYSQRRVFTSEKSGRNRSRRHQPAPGRSLLLEIEGVESGYGKLKVLRGITMSVPNGSMVALLGGNGTGKSTLLKAISGIIPVWAGKILFDGEPVQNLKPHEIVRRGLVQVTQGKDSYPGMTVEDNLKVGAFSRSDKAGVRQDMERVYELFPRLKQRRKQMSGTLSGGEVQMLVIGRGMMARPKMIMLDEPSSALAPKVVLDIFRAIHKIRKEMNMTILLVEQNVRMALLMSDYGYVIRDGVIHIEGKASEMVDDDNVRLSYLGGTVADTDVAALS